MSATSEAPKGQPTMSDFLENTRKEIEQRLEELRPTVKEYRRLERAELALSQIEEEPDDG